MRESYTHLGKSWLYRLCFGVRNFLDPIFHFQEVSILAYHSLSPAAIDTAVLPEIFEEHLQLLRERGVVFVSLEDVVAWRRKKKELPKKAVAITFDDGYADFETAALPLIEKYEIPVTLFMVGSESASRAALSNAVPLLSPEALARVHAHPLVTLGYHTYSHANLGKLIGEDLRREAAPPPVLQPPGNYFAYPGGNYSTAAIAAVHDAGYEAAFSIKPSLVTHTTHRFLFPRSVITNRLRPWEVYLRTTKAIAWYRLFTRPVRSLR